MTKRIAQAALASFVTLWLVVAAVPASAQPADVVITFNGTPPPYVGPVLDVNVQVDATRSISGVVASVAGRQTALTLGLVFSPTRTFWRGTIAIGDLPVGPYQLTVVATDVTNVTGQLQHTITKDNRPTIEIFEPANDIVSGPEVRVRARCVDDGGSCQLRMPSPPTTPHSNVVIGTEIDAILSLPISGDSGLTIQATDSAGQTSAESRIFAVLRNPRLAFDSRVPTTILDMDATRILIVGSSSPRALSLVDRATGAAQTIYQPATIREEAMGAALTPLGVIFFRYTAIPTGEFEVIELRNGSQVNLGGIAGQWYLGYPIPPGSFRVKGHWALWFTASPRHLVRRDLISGTNVDIGEVSVNTQTADVTPSGDVYFVDPADDLLRWSNGVVTTVVDTVSQPPPREPRADDTNVVYCAGSVLWRLPGPEQLSEGCSATGFQVDVDRQYRVAGGWIAYHDLERNLWVRAPDGTRRRLGPVGPLYALADNGAVAFSRGTPPNAEMIVTPDGEGEPVNLGPGDFVGVRRINGTWQIYDRTVILTPTPTAISLLAEGAASTFFESTIAVLNPSSRAVPARVTFLPEGGNPVEQNRTIPAHTRITLNLADELGGPAAASTSITALDGAPLIVERTMAWDGSGYGGHSGTAVPGARLRWFFAEGAQGYFDTFILLVNDSASATTVTLNFFVEGGSRVSRTVTVLAHARLTVPAGSIPELANTSFATVVESATPIVAERAMYFGSDPIWRGGHESAGEAAPATTWYHPEGTTGPAFDTYILLLNPNALPASVNLRFLTDAGVSVTRTYTMAPFSRRTVQADVVDPAIENASFATTVEADLPIVSERAMYWSTLGGEWQEAHNSFGLTASGVRWATADGRAGGDRGYQTFVLVANLSATHAATVRLTFMRSDGLQVTRTMNVNPSSRATFPCHDVPELADSEFGVVVDSLDNDPIVVERATYWNAHGVTWAAGTNVTATPLP